MGRQVSADAVDKKVVALRRDQVIESKDATIKRKHPGHFIHIMGAEYDPRMVLRDDIHAWLEERNWGYGLLTNPKYPNDRTITWTNLLYITFSREERALLFKLTWGGR